ncbi:M1 family metallopeptidase [Streptomyces sp. NPDC004542]|uniref:M1 family metallopeptidase n=1 Tax=Streptomyces sp. NPDC004542 TaxID=3154281 RepID=UPI0033B6B9A0
MLLRFRTPRTAALLAAGASVVLISAAAPPPATALGIGDRLYPYLGNPGYDVRSYDIAFTYKGDNSKPLEAVTQIDARATSQLDRINLDFAQGTVHSVEVNGVRADFATSVEDLIVTPPRPIKPGQPLHITVRHTSDPMPGKEDAGWVRTEDGLALANQADAAHRVFPCNDHPSDKAYFTFRITTPNGYTTVANGLPVATTHSGTSTSWVYRTAHPMATELAQVSIGRSTVLHQKGPHGLPVRDVVPAKDAEALRPWLNRIPDQIAWMEGKVGRYPFENYGVVVAEAQTGFELETQTLSLFQRKLFSHADNPQWYVDSLLVHELSHQWFGDSVTPRTWSDLWLNEGHATWYEALYAQEKGHQSMEARMRDAYRDSDAWRAADGTPAAPKMPTTGKKLSIFRPAVYDGSALVLYALRQDIGTRKFELLEREWVRTHRDSNATTADFVALASKVAGRDLSGFLKDWLYGEKTPPMPGHPEWTTGQ